MKTNSRYLLSLAALSFGIGMTCGCSDSGSNATETAGGITDIGNSIAMAMVTGTVVNADGETIKNARIVAYYDNWEQTAATDSVEAISDSNGNFSIEVDSSESLVLYAENGSECGLAFAGDTNKLVLGSRKSLESSVSGETSGYMRIVGTHETANVQPDGSFSFDAIPPGDISLVYVRDEKPQGFFRFKTPEGQEQIHLPPLENSKDGGNSYSPKFENNTYYPEYGSNWNYYDPSFLNLSLHMEGYESVFDSTHSWVTDSNFIKGISGYARVMKSGNYILLDKQNALGNSFMITLWTKWDGANENDQVLFSEKINGDSTSQIKWYFDNAKNSLAVTTKTEQDFETIYFDKATLPTDDWTFIVLAYQGNAFTLYINGEIAQTSKGIAMAEAPSTAKGNVSFYIGGTGRGNATWNGALDEYYIESYVQNAEWIKSLYQSILETNKNYPAYKKRI